MRTLLLGLVVAQLAGAVDVLEELKEVDRRFARDTASFGLDGWMSHFADDARLNTHQGVVQGKAAVREFYSKMFTRKNFKIEWKPLHAEASTDQTLGYTFGEATLSWTSAEGKAERHPGRYLTVWRKQADQSWKVIIDQGN